MTNKPVALIWVLKWFHMYNHLYLVIILQHIIIVTFNACCFYLINKDFYSFKKTAALQGNFIYPVKWTHNLLAMIGYIYCS